MQLDWNATITTLKESLPPTQFQNWLKPVEFLRRDEDTVVLGVPSRFHEEWIRNNYSHHLKHAIKKHAGSELQLEFEIMVQDENIEASLTTASPTTPASRPVLRLVQPAQEDPTSDPKRGKFPIFNHELIECEFNRIAHQLGKLFAAGSNPELTSLLIVGGIGMGKTHLLTNIGTQIHESHPRTNLRYVTAEAFTSEMVRAIKGDDTLSFKKKYRDETDFLLFDDLHQLSKRLKTQEELLYTFSEITARGGQVAFSSSVPVTRLTDFIEPLRSRLMACVITEIKPPTQLDRMALLARMAQHNQFLIDDTVIRYLAEEHGRDVRELIGALVRLHLQAKLDNKPLDSAFLQQERLVQGTPREEVTLGTIVALIEHNFRIDRTELMSKSRKGNTTWARQVIMYLARAYTSLSCKDIGEFFGRDHSTVIHASQKVAETMEAHPTKRYEVGFLRGKLDSIRGG